MASPVTLNDTASTLEDAIVAIDVVANDTDADGDLLTVELGSLTVTGFTTSPGVTLPATNDPYIPMVTNAMLANHFSSIGGIIKFNPTNPFVGTSDFNFLSAGQSLVLTLTYNVIDGTGNSVPSTLNFTINGSNEVKTLTEFGDSYNFTNWQTQFADEVYAMGGDDVIYTWSGNDLVYGGTGDDSLYGGDGADKLYGEDDDDLLSGGSGNDTLYGGNGDDRLEGGSGNDNLYGGAGADVFVGGSGFDYVRYNDASWGNLTIDLFGSFFNTGAAAGDTYMSIEGVVGGNGNDTIGGTFAVNRLFGGNGADTLEGREGVDQLTGGAGADNFVLAFNLITANADNILDFVHGTDKIRLYQASPYVLGTTVDASELQFGNSALDGNDYLIYNASTGNLYFDVDANGIGGQQLIANLLGVPTLDFNDFIMI